MLDVFSPAVPPALAVPMGQIEAAYQRLGRLVSGLSQEALDYRGPNGTLNSAAMLLRHLARVDLEYTHAIMGTPVTPELEEVYGPYLDENGRIPVVTGLPAAALLAPYHRVIDRLRDYLQSRNDAEATRPVTIPWWPQPATVRYVLWHMAGHSMYHQGHISRLQAWHRHGGGQ